MIFSVPSFIIRGTYLENVGYCSAVPEIQSVELLFFLYDDETDRLIRRELPEIQTYTDSLGFTIHMPDDIKEEHKTIIELTHDIARQYIIHPPPGDSGPFLSILNAWIDEYGDIFLLENLIGREFESLLTEEPRFWICCDTGHLLVQEKKPGDFIARYDKKIREIHLHGLVDGWDHSLFDAKERWFRDLIPWLGRFSGTCNVELFDEQKVRQVIDIFHAESLI